MTWEQIKGRWNQLQGKAKRPWGKLTDDDLSRIEGDRDKLVGLVQEKYGKAKDQTEQDVDAWFDALSTERA